LVLTWIRTRSVISNRVDPDSDQQNTVLVHGSGLGFSKYGSEKLGKYHEDVRQFSRVSFWVVNRVSLSHINIYYSPPPWQQPFKKGNSRGRFCKWQPDNSYPVPWNCKSTLEFSRRVVKWYVCKTFLEPASYDPCQSMFTFPSATSQARLNGVPRQRSMYLCLWSQKSRVENLSPAIGRGISSKNRVWNWVGKLHRLAGRYDNPMPTWFLAPISWT
jgi:hypothetical protein